VKILLLFKIRKEKAHEPILYLAKSEMENAGIRVFVTRNFYKNELVTTFVGIKTKEDNRYTL